MNEGFHITDCCVYGERTSMILGYVYGSVPEWIPAVFKKEQVIWYQTGVYIERYEESSGILG
jgi:hypothetical protein